MDPCVHLFRGHEPITTVLHGRGEKKRRETVVFKLDRGHFVSVRRRASFDAGEAAPHGPRDPLLLGVGVAGAEIATRVARFGVEAVRVYLAHAQLPDRIYELRIEFCDVGQYHELLPCVLQLWGIRLELPLYVLGVIAGFIHARRRRQHAADTHQCLGGSIQGSPESFRPVFLF